MLRADGMDLTLGSVRGWCVVVEPQKAHTKVYSTRYAVNLVCRCARSLSDHAVIEHEQQIKLLHFFSIRPALEARRGLALCR
jgi:hypothetical protein